MGKRAPSIRFLLNTFAATGGKHTEYTLILALLARHMAAARTRDVKRGELRTDKSATNEGITYLHPPFFSIVL